MIARIRRWLRSLFPKPPSVAQEQSRRRLATAARVQSEQYTPWEWPDPAHRYEIGFDLEEPAPRLR